MADGKADGLDIQDLKVRDISNSPAFTFLDELLSQGKISKEESERLKLQYQRLHEAVIQTFNSEQQVLNTAREMKAALDAERTRIEQKKFSSQDIEAEIQTLEKQEKELLGLQDQALSRMGALNLEIGNLENSKNQKMLEMKEKLEKTVQQLKPVIDELNAKMEEVQATIAQNAEALAKETATLQEYSQKVEVTSKEISHTDKEKLKKREAYNAVAAEPEKLQSSIAVIERAHREFDQEAAVHYDSIRRLDEELMAVSDARKRVDIALQGARARVDKIQFKINKAKGNLDDLKRDKDLEISQADDARDKKLQVEEETRGMAEVLHEYLKTAARYQKEYEGAKKRFERLRRKRDTVLSTLDPLRVQREQGAKLLEELRFQSQQQSTMLTEIKADEDLFISQYLSQEKQEEEITSLLISLQNDRKEYEGKISELDKQERSLQQKISKLSAQRELTAREASKASAQYRETKEDLKVKNLIMLDLGKQTVETYQRLKACSQRYEKMKNQRNKLANMTQSYSQGLAEMKEKIKILQNEVEILRNESLARERALQEEIRLHQGAQNLRDAYRVDQNKHIALYAKKAAEREQQLMEIAKLNSIVNAAERQMMQLRQDYQSGVDNRNLTGIQLIDRNDELCILHEKANIQEAILRKGEEELKNREAEIHMLTLDIADVQRRIEVARSKIPSLQVYAATTRTLKEVESQLEAERQLVMQLGMKLEAPVSGEPTSDPKNRMIRDARCRKLGGVDPEPEQLAAKTEMLEMRLNEKKEQLLERELVLDEVTSLSDKLRMQAAEKRASMLDLAKKVNEYQAKIRRTTRKMIATVSELSMYQATALKLEGQITDQERDLKQARERMTEGQPPTEDALHEWYKMERDRVIRQEALLHRSQAVQAEQSAGLVKTTADPRPNAYIPDEVGLPKPYGSLAPFKPSVLGSTMRHVRLPQPAPVKI